jgi:hypothetical protein
MSPANLPTVPEKFIGWIAKDKGMSMLCYLISFAYLPS